MNERSHVATIQIECFPILQFAPRRFIHFLFRFYRHKNFVSFQRQLNIYCFRRIAFGPDQNSYYHENFVRGRPELISQIQRIATKGSGDRHTHNSLDPPNFSQDFQSSLLNHVASTSIPSTVMPSGLMSAASSQHVLSSEEKSAALLHYLRQIEARNFAVDSPSNVCTAPLIQNTTTTLLNGEPASLITQQLIELWRHYLQHVQLPIPSHNETSIQEVLSPFQSLFAATSTTSSQMQQQLVTHERNFDENFLNRLYRSNLSGIQLSLPTAPFSMLQPQRTPAYLPISENIGFAYADLNQAHHQHSQAIYRNNLRDEHILQLLLSAALPVSVGNTALHQPHQPHSPTNYGTNVDSENTMIQLSRDVHTPAITFPSRLTQNNELNQHDSSVLNNEQEKRLSIYAMNPDGTNANLELANACHSPENIEGKKNDTSITPSEARGKISE